MDGFAAERQSNQEPVYSLTSSGLETLHGRFSEKEHHPKESHGCVSVSDPGEVKKFGLTKVRHSSRNKGSAQHVNQYNNFNNNSNAEESLKNGADLLTCEFVKKGSRLASAACHKGSVEVSLEGKSLWDEFCSRGTEMIVNRAGRRMFPGFSVAVSSLKPKMKYSMKLEVVLADNHRLKFLNSKWLAVGSAEPQPPSESYLHPDSPNSGAFWMRHGVSFRKLKITNNKERPGNNALLYSMHKYFLRLIVEEDRKATADDKSLSKVVAQLSFPETTFVAVTAYQNEEVTQLKITNNPFAKAFRENAADMDWETVQMLYNSQNTLPAYHQTDHSMGSGQMIANGTWPFSSPALPPPLMSASLPPSFSPLPGQNTPTPSSSSGASGYMPYYPPFSSAVNPQYFQWPFPSPIPPPPLSHQSPPATPLLSFYQPLHRSRPLEHVSTETANLPDFETVFTPSK